jgi:hypothetical protein
LRVNGTRQGAALQIQLHGSALETPRHGSAPDAEIFATESTEGSPGTRSQGIAR